MTQLIISTTSVQVEHVEIDTNQPYREAARRFESAIGRLEPATVADLEARKADQAAVEREASRMAGPSGLLLFARYDQGAVASLEGPPRLCRLYLVGNFAIAARIVRIEVRASHYVPFRVALFQAPTEPTARLSFDRPSSFLSALRVRELEPIGRALDQKIEAAARSVFDPA